MDKTGAFTECKAKTRSLLIVIRPMAKTKLIGGMIGAKGAEKFIANTDCIQWGYRVLTCHRAGSRCFRRVQRRTMETSGKLIPVGFARLGTCEDFAEVESLLSMLLRSFPEVTVHHGDVVDNLGMAFMTPAEKASGRRHLTLQRALWDQGYHIWPTSFPSQSVCDGSIGA